MPLEAGEPPLKGAKVTAVAIQEADSMEAIVSKLTACDGIPFSLFRTSVTLRECVQARARELGLRELLPKSDSGIKSVVTAYGNRAKELTKKALYV